MFTEVLRRLGVDELNSGASTGDGFLPCAGPEIVPVNPATGQPLGRVATATRADYDQVVDSAREHFLKWRLLPAPQRGEMVRLLSEALRTHKNDLGLLATLETGKIKSEGLGEVQEMIDMCDFAVGLSRQLYGLTIASERPQHRLCEQWHPLGPVGVITAFNFPIAVWAWNAAVAAVCGDTVVWKPSPRTPLTAIAVQKITQRVFSDAGFPGVMQLCIGAGHETGQWMADDRRLPLVSATGSCAMGKALAPRIAARLGRALLELGGNNGAILTQSANLDLALRAIVFASVGTAGQRCTTLRRLFVHESIADDFVARLVRAYKSVPAGNPWDDGVLLGPMISEQAVQSMETALATAQGQGGQIVCGGKRINRPGYYVEPAIVLARPEMPIVSQEIFAPILYVMRYQKLGDAIGWHNQVDQGLSSAIFTDSVRQAERFLSAEGSDCGIANINVGTSGAEIGGAFGGEKDTGGGREAGSDAWKAYMRRQTCTINYGDSLPLSQGVRFEVG